MKLSRFLPLVLILPHLALPLAVRAADATADEVLKAMEEATQVGICTPKTTRSGSDCVRTTITCNETEWREYVAQTYENHSGSIAFAGQGTSDAAALAVEYLRADWERNSQTPPGPVQRGSCFCLCGQTDALDVCDEKPAGFPFGVGTDMTREQCEAACRPRAMAQKCAGTLAPVAQASDPSAPSTPTTLATCFTPAECAQQQGVFEEGGGCPVGRCYAKEPTVILNQAIGDIKEVSGFNNYVVYMYRYLISIVAVVATVMFTWGAFRYLLGSALPSIARGKEIMIDAVFGLILVLSSTFILRTINPATTNLNPLKVYLVNTAKFVNVALCKNLPANAKLAEAGTRPDLQSFEQVSKNPDLFKVTPSQTKCGPSYYVKDTVGGSACDGDACPNPGEICVSCADGVAEGCAGLTSDARVCDRVEFGGTVEYQDGKFPKTIALYSVCNTVAENVNSSVEQVMRVNPKRVGRELGGDQGRTDKEKVGRAAYRFELNELQLKGAETRCANSGGLRGFLLGLTYNDGGSKTGFDLDDAAVLSQKDCDGQPFSGYQNGTPGGDRDDEFSAISCGIKLNNLRDASEYWSKDQLKTASLGQSPIKCDFILNKDNAPEEPGDRFCPARPATREAPRCYPNPGCPSCPPICQ